VIDRQRMVAGRPAHVANTPPFCPKGVVVELTREMVEGKGGKEERREKVVGRPPIFFRSALLGLHSVLTFILHFILLLSCPLH
jgi:hypothetical protein